VEVHGFCESTRVRSLYIPSHQAQPSVSQPSVQVIVLKVAPLKTVSLPRLELSAALLLERLINKIRESLEFSQCPIYLWSDSTIALNWITSPWSVFVANRVSEIQRLTGIKRWHHVASSDNPADTLSRGLNSCDFINAERWWNDPEFLKWDEKH